LYIPKRPSWRAKTLPNFLSPNSSPLQTQKAEQKVNEIIIEIVVF
jgi:hypothetical protein